MIRLLTEIAVAMFLLAGITIVVASIINRPSFPHYSTSGDHEPSGFLAKSQQVSGASCANATPDISPTKHSAVRIERCLRIFWSSGCEDQGVTAGQHPAWIAGCL